jgi:hypothetical protein
MGGLNFLSAIRALNRTELERLAPEAFNRIDSRWDALLGKYRPPGA